MVILSAFAVSISVGDVTERLRTDYLTVSLSEEMTGTTSITSRVTKDHENYRSPTPPTQEKETAGNIKDVSSGENNMKWDNTGGEREKEKIESVFSNINNKSASAVESITGDRLYNNINNVAGEELESPKLVNHQVAAGQYSGKSEEIVPSQNTGFSLIKSSHQGDTGNPYALIRAAIEKARTYPFIARKKRIEGTVVIDFTINSKGYPQDIEIGKSSGFQILDSAAIKIVMKAAPFPAVDGEIAVPISFKLTDYPPSYISSR